jgi:hypothetical protein
MDAHKQGGVSVYWYHGTGDLHCFFTTQYLATSTP